MLRIVTVVPAKEGLTGPSLALIHLLLGVAEQFGNKVKITVVTSSNAVKYPAFQKLVQRGAVCKVLNIDHLPSPAYWISLGLGLLFSGRHDVAHFSTPKVFIMMYPWSRLVSRRKILTLEGYAPYELADATFVDRTLGMVAWMAALRLADMVTACSEWLKKVVEKSNGVRDKIVTIYNPVDVERFDNSEVDGEYLLFVGRLHKVKGVDTAITALSVLRKRQLATPTLLVVGSGDEFSALRELAKELDVGDLVKFVGHQTDVERYVKRAKVVLVPSRYEPFGMTAAEAGAAGKPVVASAVGGLKEIVADGATGFLFPVDDAETLSEKIGILLSSDALRRILGENAKKRIFKNFSPKAVATTMIRLYISLFGG